MVRKLSPEEKRCKELLERERKKHKETKNELDKQLKKLEEYNKAIKKQIEKAKKQADDDLAKKLKMGKRKTKK